MNTFEIAQLKLHSYSDDIVMSQTKAFLQMLM
jgi:hypothetical protein